MYLSLSQMENMHCALNCSQSLLDEAHNKIKDYENCNLKEPVCNFPLNLHRFITVHF